jgi:hypothetical protein
MKPTFKDLPFSERFKKLGDEAESVFRSFSDAHKVGYQRTGLERPPFPMHRLPVMVRYTPDFVTANCYVEVQGFGHDSVIKLKTEKLDALTQWDFVFRTEMFLWDNVRRQVAQVPIGWFLRNLPNEYGTYPEGKEYGIWNPARIQEWTSYEPQ